MAMAVPRVAVLVATTSADALPVSPEAPESPDAATGLDVALDVASPVSPVLVADDRAVAAPEAPDVAVRSAVTVAAAPDRRWPRPCSRWGR